MATQKLLIRNVSPNPILFNYQNATDRIWYYQVVILTGQERTIWCVENTLSYSGPTNGLFITNKTTTLCGITPTPTPSITPTSTVTPTVTPTPTITSTNTIIPTPTPTPTPLDDLIGILIPDNDLNTEILFPPSPTPSVTPTNTVTPSVTPTNTVTPTVTPTETLTPTPTETEIIPETPTPTPTETVTPTPTPTPTTPYFTYSFTLCCTVTPITLYSQSSTIIVGSYLYSDTSLLTPYYDPTLGLIPGSVDCNTPFTDGILTDVTGLVTSITDTGSCN